MVLFAPYVDNGNIIAGRLEHASPFLAELKQQFARVGLASREEVPPASAVDVMGRRLDAQRHLILPRIRRMWRLCFAIRAIERRRLLAPARMRRLLGHLVDHMSARRETLCPLSASYRFVGECWCAACHRERGRFRELELPLGRPTQRTLLGALADHFDDPGHDRGFSRWAEAGMRRLPGVRPPRRSRRPRPPGETPNWRRSPASPLASALTSSLPPDGRVWWPGRGGEAAESIAMRLASRMGLRCEASTAEGHGFTLVSLGDSLAEVLAFDRSRARDWELFSLVRLGCAHQVTADIRWVRRCVEPGQVIVRPPTASRRRPLPLAAAVPTASANPAPAPTASSEDSGGRLAPASREGASKRNRSTSAFHSCGGCQKERRCIGHKMSVVVFVVGRGSIRHSDWLSAVGHERS